MPDRARRMLLFDHRERLLIGVQKGLDHTGVERRDPPELRRAVSCLRLGVRLHRRLEGDGLGVLAKLVRRHCR